MPGELIPSGFFVLRTPLLPFDDFLTWSDGTRAAAEGTLPSGSVLAHDRELLRERLRRVITRAEIREAIFVASPEVEQMIDAWVAAPDSSKGKRCERALIRYFSRMTGRSTPIGLMASTALGTVGKETSLVLEDSDRSGRNIRLSTEFLLELAANVQARPDVRSRELYRPNPTIYRAGGTIRFVRGARPGERDQLVSVRPSAAVDACLRAAEGGAEAAAIAPHVGEGPRAGGFVEAAIAAGLLVSEQLVTLTGQRQEGRLLDWLQTLPSEIDTATRLRTVIDQLEDLSRKPLGVPADLYRSIREELPRVEAAGKGVPEFAVELKRPAREAVLSDVVVGEIARAIELCHKVCLRVEPDAELVRFRERFADRYGEREIPLLEALDSELGIGFGSGADRALLLEDVLVERKERPVSWRAREQWLAKRLHQVWRDGAQELVLSQRDVEELTADKGATPLSDEIGAIAVVAAGSDAEAAAGRFQVLLKGYVGPGGVGLLTRFCVDDDALLAAVAGHLRVEESADPEAIFAEIVHLPSEPHADLLTRPVLREYEIVCVGPSGASSERQIHLSDLLVSLDGAELTLRSQRLDRRIIPRLTSGHNFESFGSKLYRFLCKLQWQHAQPGIEFWGPLEELPFLPRVRFGRVVLSRARWHLTEDLLGDSSGEDAFAAAKRWRQALRVPRLVVQTEGDRELPVDLDNVLSVEALVHAVHAKGAANLLEWFSPPDRLCVQSPEGRFAHELFVPYGRACRKPVRPRESAVSPSEAQRKFSLGSEWLFVKLYANAPAIDRILLDDVEPMIKDILRTGAADRWFFIRYEDPDFHLRVRLHGHPERLRREVQPVLETLANGLLETGWSWRVEFGTYEREIERYGGSEAVGLVEQVFHADSDAVIELMSRIRHEDERWRLGLYGAHRLLVDFELDEHARFDLAQTTRDALAAEHRLSKGDAARIGLRFRHEEPKLMRLIGRVDEEPAMQSDPVAPYEIFDERSARIRQQVQELMSLEEAGRLTRPLSVIAGSLAHMHLNRVLPARQREHELVIYDFLARVYRRMEHSSLK